LLFMPISVTCPECNSSYRVADEAAGKAIKCKKCGARVPVPAAGEEESAKARDGDDEGGGAKAPKKGGKGKLLAIIGGALVFVCCCCVLPGSSGLAYWMGWIPGIGGGGVTPLAVPGEKKDMLRAGDSKVDFGGFNGPKPARQYSVKLEKGKKYVIDMKADGKPPANSVYDPYLRLVDASGKEVAKNDDAENPPKTLDSQIKYAPNESGDFTIQASHLLPLPATGLPYVLSIKTE
jgi:predicted Zn finger-like uncharacterized protein